MPLYFAFAANLDRTGMADRCPDAKALGPGTLEGWTYFIARSGWGAARQAPGQNLPGVLWDLSDRDLAALDAFESVDEGRYARIEVPVRFGDGTVQAAIYVSGEEGEGVAVPGYQELVVAAARSWDLPAGHVRALERWLPTATDG